MSFECIRVVSFRFAKLLLAFSLFLTGVARAQTTETELQRVAEQINQMQREAQIYQQRGNGVEALRLREEAAKLWNQTVGRIAVDIERKRRAEEEMARINKEARAEQIVKQVEVTVDALKSAKAAGDWMAKCSGGPAACLASISKAKTAIEKGFDAATKQVDANVSGNTAEYAEQIRAKKEAERKDLEKSRAAMDRLSDWIDYANEAASHEPSHPSVPIGGEFRDPDAVTPQRTDADYDDMRDAVSSQGQSARDANAHAPQTGVQEPDFESDFKKTASEEQQKVAAATRDIDAKRKAADAVKSPGPLKTPDPKPDVPRTASGDKTTSSDKGASRDKDTTGEKKEQSEKKVDHCKDGAFKCPNGLPWPKCTHSEKSDCPPPEHAAEAAKKRPNQSK